VQLNPKNIDALPNTVESIRDRVNELSFNTSLMHEIKLIEFKQRLINEGITLNGALKHCYLHNISADKELGHLNLSSKLNTSWDFMMYLKDLGYKACETWIEENYEHIGKKNTLSLN
jgi:NTE family protein